MICLKCKLPVLPGEWVMVEIVSGEELPPIHKTCLEPVEWRNLLRRGGQPQRYDGELEEVEP